MESSMFEANTVQSTATTSNTDSCAAFQSKWSFIIAVSFLFSVIILIGLSFTVRRKNHLSRCSGRPGFLQPVNFIDEVQRRWAFAACFSIMTSDILSFFLGQNDLILLPTDDKEWKSKFGWVIVFAKLLESLILSLFYYPLLACINQRRFIAANVLGLLHLIPRISYQSSLFYFCPIRQKTNALAAVSYISSIQVYIGLYIVGFSYVLDLVRNIRRRRNVCREANFDTVSLKESEGNLGYSTSHHFEYVANLMRPREPEQVNETENVIKQTMKQLMKRVKYEKIIGFRYSMRIVCCTTIASTAVILMVMLTSALYEEYTQGSTVFEILYALNHENVSVAKTLYHVSNALAGLVVLIFMLNGLVMYKRRWHQLLRGDHSWHMYGTAINRPSFVLAHGLNYAGVQVAYAIWGWFVLLIFLWLVLATVTYVFIIPLTKGETNLLMYLLKSLWPAALVGIGTYVIQWLLCRFLFLQDKASSLALDNRRIYNAASYYFVVLNALIGFFSCLRRILIPLVLGILFLSRLDMPLLLKGYDVYDPGYASFVSMLLVDLYHNHPVVKVFVELMLQVRQQEQPLTEVNGVTVIQSEEKRRRSKLIRNRWWKTVTLANNPSLVLKVLEQRLKNEGRDAGQNNQRPICARFDSVHPGKNVWHRKQLAHEKAKKELDGDLQRLSLEMIEG